MGPRGAQMRSFTYISFVLNDLHNDFNLGRSFVDLWGTLWHRSNYADILCIKFPGRSNFFGCVEEKIWSWSINSAPDWILWGIGGALVAGRNQFASICGGGVFLVSETFWICFELCFISGIRFIMIILGHNPRKQSINPLLWKFSGLQRWYSFSVLNPCFPYCHAGLHRVYKASMPEKTSTKHVI